MNRQHKWIYIGLITALLLTGCKSSQPKETAAQAMTAAATDTIPEATAIPPLTDYVSAEYMTLADSWNSCDDTALAAVMKKASRGETVTIACIGGSITEGTISSGSADSQAGLNKCYADIFFEWWSDTFPDADFIFINAGIGATDSYLGVHRVQRDVLDYNPDLVLVEYSVNDGNSIIDKRNYDNLVRKILLSETNPAVMLLFMGQTDGATAQDVHALIGFNYKLPMVSYINVINAMMNDNLYTTSQLSGDVTHPSALGHAITGELLWKYLNAVYTEMDRFGELQPFDQSPVTNEVYINSEILDSLSLTPTSLGSFSESRKFDAFPNGWTCEEGEGNLIFTVTCSRLGLLYYCTTDGKSGQFEVYIDGEYTAALDADFSGGWGNYAAAREIYSSGEASSHTVEIKKAADSAGDSFTLLGILVTH